MTKLGVDIGGTKLLRLAEDGQTWRVPEYTITGSLDYSHAARSVRYSVTVEPHGKHWLFALDVPTVLPPGSSIRHDLEIRPVRPVDTRATNRFNPRRRAQLSGWVNRGGGITWEREGFAPAEQQTIAQGVAQLVGSGS